MQVPHEMAELRSRVTIQELVSEAQALFPVAIKKNAFVLIRRGEYCYKVRRYNSQQEAEQQLHLVSLASNMFAPCLGRINNFLVFEFIDTQDQHVTIFNIGNFLVSLEAKALPPKVTYRFSDWLNLLETRSVFQPATLDVARQVFKHSLSSGVDWRLQYLDALPRNFASVNDTLFCIDEKHLQIAPRGTSLAKPRRDLPTHEYHSLHKQYLSLSGQSPFRKEYLDLTTLFQLTYALGHTAPDCTKRRYINWPWFYHARRVFLKLLPLSAGQALRELVPWTIFEYQVSMARYAKRTVISSKRHLRRQK